MNKREWLQQAIDNGEKLTCLVAQFHPTSNQGSNLPITAAIPEANCCEIRKSICRDTLEFQSAAQRFKEAITKEDADTIYNLLQETWFGVPESTSCWSLTGFREAVDLLDDMWEENDN